MTTQRVAGLEQLAERGEQLGDVVEVQARRRLVEDVQQALAAVRRQVRGNLDPLRLAARERRRRLAEPEIAEADLVEHLQPAQHLRRAAEERQRLAHGEVEHLVDRSAAVPHLEHLRLEALAVALVAGHEDVGEELHLDADFALRPGTPRSGRPGTLNEKWLAVRPRERASFVAANSSRIGSNALRYVTGFERGVRPIGAWSTSTTSVMNSTPSSARNAPTLRSQPPFARFTAA